MPVSPIQPERYCTHCGVKLSRYNPDALCWSCQQGKRGNTAKTGVSSSPLGSHVHHSAFTLRSILDTVRRIKPIHFSDVGQVLFQDKVSSFTPIFNPVMLQEVRIRGLISVKHVSEVQSLLQQETAQSLSISIAPQWHVLSSLTKAEAQFSLGNLDDGLADLKKALIGAEICKLPHQVQRAIRAIKSIDSYTPAQNLGIEAQLLLDKLSEETLQLSMPR